MASSIISLLRGLFSHLEQLRVLLDDVHEDVVDVAPQLEVDVALLLQSAADLK